MPAEADLAELASRVCSHLHGWQIASATLANPGALEGALESVGARPLIYPHFMTDGWFVRSALPKRLGATPVEIFPPLGIEPDLPNLVAEFLIANLERKRWLAAETTLLVASHGSGRSPNSKYATERFVGNLLKIINFGETRIGYIEEPPFLGDAAVGSQGQVLCLPFFAAYGGHVKDDIVNTLQAAALKGSLLDPIGTLEAVPALIAASLSAAPS